MSTIIEVEKLKKTFRSFQLHDIAFHVSEGCITGLIGIDGSGKSTIIKCLINLIQRDSGKVVLAPGENRHSGPGENRQFWPDENRQSLFTI